MTSSQDFTSSENDLVSHLLRDARKRLVETGTRNRLVHVNRANKRSKAIAVINERSDAIYDLLRARRSRMSFLPILQETDEEGAGEVSIAALESTPTDGDGRLTDNYLEVASTPDRLSKKLLRLALDAKTAEEEQGTNVLYLALGFLEWYEAKASAVKREAPLILLPVQLVRNAKTATYDIVCRDEDVITNLSLQKRLLEDFGIQLPIVDEEAEDWSPSAYFEAVGDAIASKENWRVDADGMMLGFFSFAKLLMLNDLDPANWPSGKLTAHRALQGLLSSNGFPEQTSLFLDDDRLDEKLEPADIIQVVDADASQTKVIEEVRSGRDLVVQGPPGTGKSQTITNIISAAVHDGKTVLFVAEKMAALSVVHKRLKDVGLADVCLELHSRAANKRSVIEELDRTLKNSAAMPNVPSAPEKLMKCRDTLNAVSKLMHTSLPKLDYSPYEAISGLIASQGNGAPVPKLEDKTLAEMSKKQIGHVIAKLSDYQRQIEQIGQQKSHPFFGVQNMTLQPTDLSRLKQDIGSFLSELQTALRAAKSLSHGLRIDFEHTFAGFDKLLSLMNAFATAPLSSDRLIKSLDSCKDEQRLEEACNIATAWVAAYEHAATAFVDPRNCPDISDLRAILAQGQSSYFSRWLPAYQKACRTLAGQLKTELPKSPAKKVALVDLLHDFQRADRDMVDEVAFLETVLKDNWRGLKTDLQAISEVQQWRRKIRSIAPDLSSHAIVKVIVKPDECAKYVAFFEAKLPSIGSRFEDICSRLNVDIQNVFSASAYGEISALRVFKKFKTMFGAFDSYDNWARLGRSVQWLHNANQASLLELVEIGEVPASRIVEEFKYALAEAQWRRVIEVRPNLLKIADMDRHAIVKQFGKLERDRLKDTRAIILSKYRSRLPGGTESELGTIRREIGRKRGHMPIRRLISRAGGALQRLKPVFLMSPISVAQFLPPAELEFDLLVIDEASQIRPEDALGSIARAKQIVVVGDTKQLPPTNFFNRLSDESDEDEELDDLLDGVARATEMESILTLCEAQGVNQRMLSWHYRSRDPSLIRVSNIEFYDDGLTLPPSPLQNDPSYGLSLKRVDGVFHGASSKAGRPGTNPIEAQAVVDAVLAHAENSPELSLGIVTFSVKQRDMITELLEHNRRNHKGLDSLLRENKSENIFVKNIENVQGDERDVIFISVGYGPNVAGGRLASMRFGPVNSDGGERRLNVLFSRARAKCQVFVSFAPGDIDLERTSKVGPRVLKKFLRFAQTGQVDLPAPTGADADSPFEEDVANEIRKLGYEVDYQVGSGGFKIDLGVRNPDFADQYMLAVECDGATYHSALWARERDRLRQDVLEGLGWKFHRIWSTDWFHRRAHEIERLGLVLKQSRAQAEDGLSIKGANIDARQYSDAVLNNSDPNAKKIDAEELTVKKLSVPRYKRAELSVHSQSEVHELPRGRVGDLIIKIIEIEGPLHQEEITRRVASTFGTAKAGRRIVELSFGALKSLPLREGSSISEKNEFWATSAQWEAPPVRDRSEETGATLAPRMLPPSEIIAAAGLIESEYGTLTLDAMVKTIANLFGFKRVGADLRQTIERALHDADLTLVNNAKSTLAG